VPIEFSWQLAKMQLAKGLANCQLLLPTIIDVKIYRVFVIKQEI